MDIYAEVTSKIIEKLEAGEIPWKREWVGKGGACNYVTGREYSLINQLLLKEPGEYATFKQVKDAGGCVKKGAKSKVVIFWKLVPMDKEAARAAEEAGEEYNGAMLPVLRYYNVFNIMTDCEGLKPRHQGELRDFDPIEKADAVIDGYVQREGISMEHVEQSRACYSPKKDRVTLPLKEQFKTNEGYYSVAFHELVHSTGHEKRLNRTMENAAFGDENYSMEELVAEIGSADIMHTIGIETDDTLTNTAAYVQNWIKALKNDKRMIVMAAAKAEKAAEMVLGV